MSIVPPCIAGISASFAAIGSKKRDKDTFSKEAGRAMLLQMFLIVTLGAELLHDCKVASETCQCNPKGGQTQTLLPHCEGACRFGQNCRH